MNHEGHWFCRSNSVHKRRNEAPPSVAAVTAPIPTKLGPEVALSARVRWTTHPPGMQSLAARGSTVSTHSEKKNHPDEQIASKK